MLRADLDNENETIRNYRERVRQCEALGEYAMAEDIREILRQEQEHQIDLATALGHRRPGRQQGRPVRKEASLGRPRADGQTVASRGCSANAGMHPDLRQNLRPPIVNYFFACSMRATRIFSYAPSKSA